MVIIIYNFSHHPLSVLRRVICDTFIFIKIVNKMPCIAQSSICIISKKRDNKKLSKEEIGEIAGQTKALVFHKVGDMARLQTDTIIIGAFINVTTVSFVGHYNYVMRNR